MRIAAEIGEEALHHRKDQTLVCFDDAPEEWLVFGEWPEGVIAERPPAEHPSLHEIGVHVARLFDRKVTLVDRAVALRAEAHLVFHRAAREHLLDSFLRFVVERGINTMSGENREADLAQRIAQVLCKSRLAHIASSNLELLVELFFRVLSKVIGLALLHLVVADEVLIRGADAVVSSGHDRRG